MFWFVCIFLVGLTLLVAKGTHSERQKSLAFADGINGDVALDWEKFQTVFDENDKELCAIILILVTAIRLKFNKTLNKSILSYANAHKEFELIEVQKFLYASRKMFQQYNVGHVSLAFAVWLFTIKSFNAPKFKEKMTKVWMALIDSAQEIPSVITVIKAHPVVAKLIDGNETEIHKESYFMPFAN